MPVQRLATAALMAAVSVPALGQGPEVVLPRAAPAASIAYLRWYGEPDLERLAKTNRAAALLADRQLQRSLAAARQALRALVIREARAEAILAAQVWPVFDFLWRRPFCAFVVGANPAVRGPSVRAGAVVHVGDAEIGEWLTAAEDWIRAENRNTEPPEPLVVDGVEFRGLPIDTRGPDVYWAVTDGYLVIAMGDDMAKTILDGMRGGGSGIAESPDLQALAGAVRVAHPQLRTFVNLPELWRQSGAIVRDFEEVSRFLGLDAVGPAVAESGFEGREWITRARFRLREERSGALAALGSAELTADGARVIPPDAYWGVAMAVDPAQLWQSILHAAAVASGHDPEVVMAEVEGDVEQELGVKLRQDVLSALHPEIHVYAAPGVGNALTGAVATLRVRDPVAFARVFDRLMKQVQRAVPTRADVLAENPRRRLNGTFLESFALDEHTRGWFLNIIEREVFVAPAWCLHGDRLHFALYPQSLSQLIGKVDASVAPAAATAGPGVVLDAFVDLSRVSANLEVFGLPVLTMMFVEAQREGFPFHVGQLPTTATLSALLGRNSLQLSHSPTGLDWVSRGHMPSVDPVLLSAFSIFDAVDHWF